MYSSDYSETNASIGRYIFNRSLSPNNARLPQHFGVGEKRNTKTKKDGRTYAFFSSQKRDSNKVVNNGKHEIKTHKYNTGINRNSKTTYKPIN